MRRLKSITSIEELLKHDAPYPVSTVVVILFERSAWRKLSGYLLWRKS